VRSLAGGYSSSVTLERDTWFVSIRHTSEFEGIFRQMQAREENARLALMQDVGLNWVRS